MNRRKINTYRKHFSYAGKKNSYLSTRRRSAAKRKPWKELLDFVKDWGGVATLLIAILYTFPLGIFDRVTSSHEKEIGHSRQILADGSSMMIERIVNTSKITDARSLEMMNNMYNAKFFNLIYSNSQILKKYKNDLSSSELAILAALHGFSGLTADALIYYDSAIDKAKEEKAPYPNILRDKAQLLAAPGPTRNIPLARKSYLEVLEFFASNTHPLAKRQFAIFLSELASIELATGDWACGNSLRKTAENGLQLIRFYDPSIAVIQDFAAQNYAAAKQAPDQPAVGCGYTVPLVTF